MGTPVEAASILHRAERHRASLSALLLIFCGALAYQNALGGPFLPDDDTSIPQNPGIRRLVDLRAVLSPPVEVSVSGRPLVALTLAVNYAIGGLDVRGYHLTNLGFHLLCGLLLLGVLRRTLRSPRLAPWCRERADAIALAVAVLWLLHPLQTESVNYVIQRTELLMALFFLLTLYSTIRAAAAAPPSARAAWQALAVISCLAGTACKEVMAVCPALVLLHDAIFLGGSLRQALRARWLLYLGLLASWIPLALLISRGPRAGSVGLDLGVTGWEYAVVQLGVVARYLRLSLWPHPLVVDYGGWAARDPGTPWLAGIVLLLLLVATLFALRRWPPLGFLGVWFFTILAPTSSVIPIVTELAAERRMYLPLAAVLTALVVAGTFLLARLSAARSARLLGVASVFLLSVVLGGVTLARNEDYRSAVVLWHDTVAKRPANPRAWVNLDLALADQATPRRIELLRGMVRRYPSAAGHTQLGVREATAGRLDEAERSLRVATEIDPRFAPAHANLGGLRLRRGDAAGSARSFERAISLDPGLAEYHAELGRARLRLGDRSGAERALQRALQLDARRPATQSYLGQLRLAERRQAEALVHFRRAVSLAPRSADLQNELGMALGEVGDLPGAVAAFRKAVTLRPRDPRLQRNLNIALARLAPSPSSRSRH